MPTDRRRRAQHLVEPPAAVRLRTFPYSRLNPTKDLYRVHRAELDPWYFANRGAGRFDLTGAEGTCYLAVERHLAFIEVFYGLAIVPLDEIATHRLSTLHIAARARLADCTSSRAVAFGVTAEMHTTVDYGLTQRWAANFREAGFAGIRYWARHDPGKGYAMALFGAEGAHGGQVESTTPIGADVQGEILRRYGVVFLDSI